MVQIGEREVMYLNNWKNLKQLNTNEELSVYWLNFVLINASTLKIVNDYNEIKNMIVWKTMKKMFAHRNFKLYK